MKIILPLLTVALLTGCVGTKVTPPKPTPPKIAPEVIANAAKIPLGLKTGQSVKAAVAPPPPFVLVTRDFSAAVTAGKYQAARVYQKTNASGYFTFYDIPLSFEAKTNWTRVNWPFTFRYYRGENVFAMAMIDWAGNEGEQSEDFRWPPRATNVVLACDQPVFFFSGRSVRGPWIRMNASPALTVTVPILAGNWFFNVTNRNVELTIATQ